MINFLAQRNYQNEKEFNDFMDCLIILKDKQIRENLDF